MTIGERIKELRTEKGYSLRTLATALGVSAPTLQRYETGEIPNISPAMINKLADALGTSASWLLGEHEQTAKNAVTFELSSTESMLLRMYREFDPAEKDIVRNLVLTINNARLETAKMLRKLEFAEDFIKSTEYESAYLTEKEENSNE